MNGTKPHCPLSVHGKSSPFVQSTDQGTPLYSSLPIRCRSRLRLQTFVGGGELVLRQVGRQVPCIGRANDASVFHDVVHFFVLLYLVVSVMEFFTCCSGRSPANSPHHIDRERAQCSKVDLRDSVSCVRTLGRESEKVHQSSEVETNNVCRRCGSDDEEGGSEPTIEQSTVEQRGAKRRNDDQIQTRQAKRF